MDILEYKGEGYRALMDSDGWRVAFLRYGPKFAAYNQLERHMCTDEVFLLVEGSAVLYVEDQPYVMEKCKMYNVPRAVWHHIVVTPDATVMIVENANTSKENSEHISLEEYRKGDRNADK
ncbi:MAG: hypothetical protein E7662_08410 [Ruminococcaceae bacterium]|nr:hypothetical protein [Oscillospiraceae bacterium]